MKLLNKITFIIIGHLFFIGITIYQKWGNLNDMFFTIIPIISSLFFFFKSNIYGFSKIFHFIREKFIPVKFNWKISIRFDYDSDEQIIRDELREFLLKLNTDFDISFPTTGNSFFIKNSGRNTEVKFNFNSNYFFLELYYDTWSLNTFKKNFDEHIGILFEYIKEEFKSKIKKEIYSINGKCDKHFTNSDIWKLLSDKNKSKIDISYNHEIDSQKAFLSIIKNNDQNINEEIQIPSVYSIKKVSSLLEDYMNLSLTK